jgi:hypothetical protein
MHNLSNYNNSSSNHHHNNSKNYNKINKVKKKVHLYLIQQLKEINPKDLDLYFLLIIVFKAQNLI